MGLVEVTNVACVPPLLISNVLLKSTGLFAIAGTVTRVSAERVSSPDMLSLYLESKEVIAAAAAVTSYLSAISILSTFTVAMGQAWVRVCEMMVDGKFGPIERLDNGKIQSVFLGEFKSLFAASLSSLKRDRSN